MKKYLLGIAALALFSAAPAFANQQVCPIITGGSADGILVSSVANGVPTNSYVSNQTGQANEGCNVLITFGAGGSITTTNPNAAISYDNGLDDNLIGIVNNSGSTISSIALNGGAGNDIFGWDFDGACDPTWTFSASGAGGTSPCGTPTFSLNGGSMYFPQGVSATGINGAETAGTVDFAGGIPNGGTAWFSLEGPVDLNLTVTTGATPEPGTLVLFGSGLIGLAGVLRRKLVK